MNIAYDNKNSIIFNDYLDLLFNDFSQNTTDHQQNEWHEKTRLKQYEEVIKMQNHIKYSFDALPDKRQKDINLFTGGLLLPKEGNPGSGNILIIGRPGVGKSTLAFQIAAACASKINQGIAVYYSLEESSEHLIGAMCDEVKDKDDQDDDLAYIRRMNIPSIIDSAPTSSKLCEYLIKALKKDKNENIIPQIFFPSLSPRGIKSNLEMNNDLFWLRYKQLEYMLKAIKKYNKEAQKKPLIKAVIIDSLDVFGEELLTREELYRIFSLFKKEKILGVFTAEAHDGQQNNMDYSQYIADVVVSLEYDEYNNYFCRYFEITKSRYVRQVNGKHPYKFINLKESDIKAGADNEIEGKKREDKRKKDREHIHLKKKISVYPSLHYITYATESRSEMQATKPEKNIFGINQLEKILPEHFKNRNNDIPQVIMIEGEGGLYKSDIAINALLNGIFNEDSQNALIIRMSDRSSFAINGCRLSVDLTENPNLYYEMDQNSCLIPITCSTEDSNKAHKYTLDIYEFRKKTDTNAENEEHQNEKDEKDGDEQNKKVKKLIEIAFKSGALLAEEFVAEVCRVINEYQIKRVAMVDIRTIGTSYPFLINSRTSGTMFLPTFIHIMRNYGIHLIMSCSRTKVVESNKHVNKACALADTVITCSYDKSNKNVYIMGEGSIVDDSRYYIHTDTGKAHKKWRFKIDGEHDTVELDPFSIDVYKE